MTKRTTTLSRRTFSAECLGTFALLAVRDSAPADAAAAPMQTSIAGGRSNTAIVTAFCAAFAAKDAAAAVALLADDCSYRITQTRPPIVGKAQVADTIKGFINRGAEFKVLRTLALGPIVLNEREDVVVMTEGTAPRTFRIAAGLFYLENGKIVEWTDYLGR